MISFEGVTVVAGGRTILDRVTFTIAEGQRVVVTGDSGAGKTTLLLTLLGARVPTAGVVRFRGEPLSATTISGVRRSIAYIPQQPVPGADTVRQALLVPFTFRAHSHNRPDDAALRAVLERLRLDPDMLDRGTGGLSGGEMQRLAIARALLLGKTVFVCDEVTSALDVQSRQAVLDLFQGSACTIVSVSHDRDWIQMCRSCYTLADGRLIQSQ